MEHEHFVLGLLNLPRVGRKSAWKAMNAIPEPPRTSDAFFDVFLTLPKPRPEITPDDARSAWSQAEQTLQHAIELGITVIAATRPEFPQWLKSIADPPPILFVKGDQECIKNPLSVAVIGTREPSDFGRKVAHRFGLRSAEAGLNVISGLAVGCDSAAHRGCLDGNGKTVAVLAHGLDRVYPKECERLAEEIVEKGGCLVSEYSPGTRAQRSYFIERDRLQSGLASGVIVVETDTEGGTMHTVRFAEDQGRPLAALSHPDDGVVNEKSRGNIMLIQTKRAKPLKEAEDLNVFISCVRETAHHWASFIVDHGSNDASDP